MEDDIYILRIVSGTERMPLVLLPAGEKSAAAG